MRISTFFFLLRQRLKVNTKINIILIIIMSLILVNLLCSNLIAYSISQYINSFEKNIELRTIRGFSYSPNNYENIKEKIEKIENVEMVVSQYEKRVIATEYCKQFENGNTDGFIEIHPINVKTCPEIICGRRITNNDKYVIILPSKIYANSEYRNFISNDEFIETNSLINKDIDVKFETENNEPVIKKFKVIGIYDSNIYNDTKTPYIPSKIIKEINDEIGYIPNTFQLNIVVDKLENLEYVNNYIYENNIIQKNSLQNEIEKTSRNMSILETNFSQETDISLDTLDILKKISYFLVIISLVLFCMMLLAINVDKVYFSSIDIGIMRIQGYTKKNIQLITIVENIILCITSFFISVIIFTIIKYIIIIAINYYISIDSIGITFNEIKEQLYYIKQISLKINVFYFAINLLIVILAEICNTYLINKLTLSKTISQNLKRK